MMLFRFYLIATILFGSVLQSGIADQIPQQEIPSDWREELAQINAETKEAQDLRRRYLAAAARAEDEGMRWQFMQNEKQEARRAFQRAEDKRKAAEMLQARIDVLNARKAQILQEHPEANDSKRSD